MMTAIKEHDDEMTVNEMCSILHALLDELKRPRRIAILKSLPFGQQRTFEELRIQTRFSTGSLHHHLSELCNAGLVSKTQDWPRKYERSLLINRLIIIFNSTFKT